MLHGMNVGPNASSLAADSDLTGKFLEGQCGSEMIERRRRSQGRVLQNPLSLGVAAKACAALLIAGLMLPACGSNDDLRIEPVPGFDGIVATGEPTAALVGREVLAYGGTVADAAVAVSFALSVTYPSRVSLGGGGICLLHYREGQIAEALSFLPFSASSGGVPPGLTRGLEALHARYGYLKWQSLVAPAEFLARFGFKTSRALTVDLIAAQGLLRQDPAAAALFLPGGQALASGTNLQQPMLARTLAGIRAEGASLFLTGPTGPTFAKESTAAGLRLDESELRNRVPEYLAPLRLEIGSDYLYVTPPPASNGVVIAEIFRILSKAADYKDEDTPGRRHHLFLEASAQGFADRGGWLGANGLPNTALTQLFDEDALNARLAGLGNTQHKPAANLVPRPREVVEPLAGTAFVIGDRYGNALACSMTNNGLFGAGRLASTSGILMAAPPLDNLVVSPVAALVTSIGTERARLAAGASGGAAGATALARFLVDVIERDISLSQALQQVRVHHNGLPDIAFVEEHLDADSEQVLVGLGHRLQAVPSLGEVQAWYCPEGILQAPQFCRVEADPRGFGLSTLSP